METGTAGRVQRKVALVTGAGRGQGRSYALRLALGHQADVRSREQPQEAVKAGITGQQIRVDGRSLLRFRYGPA